MLAVLILLATCLFGVTLTVVAFAIPMQGDDDEALREASASSTVPYGHFFLDEAAAGEAGTGLTQPTLLHQLEEHVRLEHRAAEAFLQGPSVDSLHAASSDTSSWN